MKTNKYFVGNQLLCMYCVPSGPLIIVGSHAFQQLNSLNITEQLARLLHYFNSYPLCTCYSKYNSQLVPLSVPCDTIFAPSDATLD